ncbi:hypothetical protein PRIPAC_84881 [Pristionchus pacificus]|uniref:Uncharacterized protein n=1 Tax=Pristionchus pacificus TaxID=54126 RepID=A0A454XN37_PRIPA|nr:hypothetical protein PRIPAC_84881 [Pristionchus pacificus]|eukprot:PDM68775.1 hypothetical protein PRIPAC_47077 [Pristionchus pacificus]
MENITEDVQWVMDLFHGEPSSYIILYAGYALLALMVVACVKEGVFWKRAHDVFLLLFFAGDMDMLELNSKYFLFSQQNPVDHCGVNNLHAIISVKRKLHYTNKPTFQCRWCQLFRWMLINHFTYSFVEAVVSIYRFVTRTLEKAMPVCFVYVALGLYFGLQAFFFYYSFGKPGTLINLLVSVNDDVPFILRVLGIINTIIYFGCIPVAPILSVIMRTKDKKSPVEKNEWSVAAFNIPSTFSTLFLVYFTWWVMAVPHEKLAPEYRELVKMVYFWSFIFQYFRFFILTVSAIVLVGDIRRAVLSLLLRPNEKPNKEHFIIPQLIANPNYIDDNLN